ncbi:unnamed protein product [Knipowitschia caucasica]
MVNISDFFDASSEEFLFQCTKEQLIDIGKRYDLDLDMKRLKENLRSILVANLIDLGVLKGRPLVTAGSASATGVAAGPEAAAAQALTYEQ